MKKLYTTFLALGLSAGFVNAQVCDSTGNVVLYSNYDGGILNINVDQNIPNLKIGVCTYEAVRIQLSGAFVNNVTEVRYAGYNGTNDNCSLGVTNTTITGAPTTAATSIVIYPSVGYANSNGDANMVCNYSCNNTSNQGGCNTPDQVVYYFVNAFGGTYRSHFTQYSCFTNVNNFNISSGGNCCIVPTTLAVNNISVAKEKQFFPNPVNGELNIRFYSNTDKHEIEILNVMGQKVGEMNFAAEAEKGKIDLRNLASGIYFVKMKEGQNTVSEKIVIQ